MNAQEGQDQEMTEKAVKPEQPFYRGWKWPWLIVFIWELIVRGVTRVKSFKSQSPKQATEVNHECYVVQETGTPTEHVPNQDNSHEGMLKVNFSHCELKMNIGLEGCHAFFRRDMDKYIYANFPGIYIQQF